MNEICDRYKSEVMLPYSQAYYFEQTDFTIHHDFVGDTLKGHLERFSRIRNCSYHWNIDIFNKLLKHAAPYVDLQWTEVDS